jgi:hypothetical protein
MATIFGVHIGRGDSSTEVSPKTKYKGPTQQDAERILGRLSGMKHIKILPVGGTEMQGIKGEDIFYALPSTQRKEDGCDLTCSASVVYWSNMCELYELAGHGDGTAGSAGSSKRVTNMSMDRDFFLGLT